MKKKKQIRVQRSDIEHANFSIVISLFFHLFGFIDKKLISDTSAGKEQYRLNLDSEVVGSPFKWLLL